MGSECWKRQLELAIAWNRVDIAETEIFTEESQWKVGTPNNSRDLFGTPEIQTPPYELVPVLYSFISLFLLLLLL